MRRILPVADAIACLLNNAVASDEFSSLTGLRESPFALVAVAPQIDRVDSRKLRCYVEPVGKQTNTNDSFDCDSPQWASSIGVVFCQRLDDPGIDDNQPASMDEIRRLICFVEDIGQKFVGEWRTLTTDDGTARLIKPDSEHELISREWINSNQVFYSQISVTYG